MPPQRAPSASTAEHILDLAEARVQTLGFNGFSYADIAGEMGVTTASIHYHFRGKADLGKRLIERYADRFMEALAEIDARPISSADKLAAYAGLYEAVLAQGKLCLCGMLAAEYVTLAEPMKAALHRFFERNEEWLVRLLEGGQAAGELWFRSDARAIAAALVSALEGAMLVARVHGGVESFRTATGPMFMSFKSP